MLRSAGDAGPRPLLIWNFKSSSFTPPLQPAFGPAERTPHPAAQRRKNRTSPSSRPERSGVLSIPVLSTGAKRSPVYPRHLDRSEAKWRDPRISLFYIPSSRPERSGHLCIPVISTEAKRSGETPAFRSSTSPSSRPKRSGVFYIPVISTGAKRSGEIPAFFFVPAFAPNSKQRHRQTASKYPPLRQDSSNFKTRPSRGTDPDTPAVRSCKFNPCSPSAAPTHAN
jgi:hypothetical protein